MKLKRRYLVIAVILSVILTANMVSADENITCDATAVNDDACIAEVSESEDADPEISVPSKIWAYGSDNITIDTAETAKVNITGAISYSNTIAAGKTSIPLNLTEGKHSILLDYLSNTTIFQKKYNITVLKDSPDWDMNMMISTEGDMVCDGMAYEMTPIGGIVNNIPKGLTGTFRFYVNDKLESEYNITDDNYNIEYEFYVDDLYLDYETYDYFRMEYLGDDYFKAVNRTSYLNLSYFSIRIPSKIYLGYDDAIRVASPNSKTGTLKIYINDELFRTEEIKQRGEFDSYEYYSESIYTFSLSHLKVNQTYDIRVMFLCRNSLGINYRNITKEISVNVTDRIADYVEFPQYRVNYRYGEEIYFKIDAVKLNYNMLVDGKKVDCTYNENYNRYNLYLGKLSPGYHDITVSYDGDSHFIKNTFKKTIYVYLEPDYDYSSKQYEKAWFNLTLPEDANGNLTMEVKRSDDEHYHFYRTVPVKNGKVNVELPTEHIGYYTLKCSYDDGNYEIDNMITRFDVAEQGILIGPNSYNELNKKIYLSLTLPEDAEGTLTVQIKKDDEENYTNYTTQTLENGKAKIQLPTNHPGTYHIRTAFKGNYEIFNETRTYHVRDGAVWSNLNYYAKLNEKIYLNLTLPEDATGTLTVQIKKDDEENYTNYTTQTLENGKAKIRLPTNHIGTYLIKTVFKGNYEVLNHDAKYVISAASYISTPSEEVEYDSEAEFSLTLPDDATGKLTLELKDSPDENYTVYESEDLKNGKATIKLPVNQIKKYYYRVYFTGNYEIYSETGSFQTNPIYYENGIFYLFNETGEFEIQLDYITVSLTYLNGTDIEVDLNYLIKEAEDGQRFRAKLHNDGFHYLEVNITPIYDIELITKDMSVYYGDGSAYEIKVLRNGKPVGENKNVTVKIKSKTYYVPTDKNGVAKLKINELPGKYTIKTEHKTKTKTNRLTVKEILKLKKVSVKKSAKKLVLTAKLSKKIKGKKITFKFNGKKYTVKTNKKGVAKVTVKKSVLKKLKAGKKLTYSATYLKTTKKITVKIKK